MTPVLRICDDCIFLSHVRKGRTGCLMVNKSATFAQPQIPYGFQFNIVKLIWCIIEMICRNFPKEVLTPRLIATDEIHLTDRQKPVLGRITQQQKAQQRLAARAKIVLLADEQKGNWKIANALHIKRSTDIKWRRRWTEQTETLAVLEEESDEKRYA